MCVPSFGVYARSATLWGLTGIVNEAISITSARQNLLTKNWTMDPETLKQERIHLFQPRVPPDIDLGLIPCLLLNILNLLSEHIKPLWVCTEFKEKCRRICRPGIDTSECHDAMTVSHLRKLILLFGSVVHHPVQERSFFLDYFTPLLSPQSIKAVFNLGSNDFRGLLAVAPQPISRGEKPSDDKTHPRREHSQNKSSGERINREVNGYPKPFRITTRRLS